VLDIGSTSLLHKLFCVTNFYKDLGSRRIFRTILATTEGHEDWSWNAGGLHMANASESLVTELMKNNSDTVEGYVAF
jgi:hypothetical protein